MENIFLLCGADSSLCWKELIWPLKGRIMQLIQSMRDYCSVSFISSQNRTNQQRLQEIDALLFGVQKRML